VSDEVLGEALRQLLGRDGMSASAAAKEVATTLGVRKNVAYKMALALSAAKTEK
jgi:hypothetical protein